MLPPDLPDSPESSVVGGKKKSKMRGILWMSLFVLILGAAALGWFVSYALSPGPEVDSSEAIVFIPKGTSVEKIAGLLGEAKLLDPDFRFLLLTRFLNVSAKLPAGEFRLDTNQTPVELLKQLVTAEPVQHQITIAEGLRLEEIAAIFAASDWVDEDHFSELTRDPGLIAEFGLGAPPSLEGYLFPDTYRLRKPSPGAKAIITRLVNRSLEVWQSLDHGTSDLGRHEVFTLASIVEKETGKGDERPLIASVFHNRLRRNMKLQSDPTVIYGIADFNGSLTKKNLTSSTPYNTYQIAGLPPGPICSPGKDSLQAVLTPADSKYLYFVSKNDGSHHFSTNLREHNRAVRKYQR